MKKKEEDVFTRHELSAVFGDMSAADFKELVNDIRMNGQLDPITVIGTEVIDGWHRYRACMEVGVEPIVEDYVDEMGSVESLVLTRNLHRRHSSAEERARAAAKVLKYQKGARGKNKTGATIKDVAKAAGIGVRTAERALSGSKPPNGGLEKSTPKLSGDKAKIKRLESELSKVKEELRLAKLELSKLKTGPRRRI